ncbi:MAG TPA: tetratricopeptide repeat protein [Pirellulales bacterium]|jgi:tetratricopeptide (TPR) repeat protein|nr:tetratricopeptide repeat protein [Pirellulales bacterium]
MTPRPLIFISTVSKELRSARQLVSNTLQFLGYEPVWQDIFGTEAGDLREMLRHKIDDCQGLVQLVGHCYGAEPPTTDETFGRVSYTQYEALYGRQRKKKVWYLFLEDDFPIDPHEPESPELRQLQAAYRARVQADMHLYHPLRSRDALEAQVLKLRDDLGRLRRGVKQWAWAVALLLVLLVGLSIWLVHRESVNTESVEKMSQLLREGVMQFASVQQTQSKSAQHEQSEDAADDRTYTELAKKLGVDERTLREQLPKFAEQLQNSASATTYERANAAYVAKDYANAEKLALQAAEEAKNAAPLKKTDVAQALQLAGQAASQQIKYDEAVEHFHAAEQACSREDDPVKWSEVQYSLAGALYYQGHYREAKDLAQTAYEEFAQSAGAEDIRTLRCQFRVALCLMCLGKFADAQRQFAAILAIAQKAVGPENSFTLSVRSAMANMARLQGKFAESEQECRAVLEIAVRAMAADDPIALSTRNTLGNALLGEGKYTLAEYEHRANLAIRLKSLGPENPSTLFSRQNVANALLAEGDAAAAEKEFQDVLAIRRRVLGSEHPDTQYLQSLLAQALANNNQSAEAEKLFRDLLAIQERLDGPESSGALSTQSWIGTTLYRQGKYDQAETQFRNLLAVRQRLLGRENSSTLFAQTNLANALMAEKKYADAEQNYRSILAADGQKLGPENETTLAIVNSLALALHKQGRDAEAQPLAQRAADAAKKVLGPGQADTIKYRQLVEELQSGKK